MNAYFTIVLIAFLLFFVVWGLGWLLERLSQVALQTTRKPGSRAWYGLVGPGVALHESSHALGCIFTGTEIVEFKQGGILCLERCEDKKWRISWMVTPELLAAIA